MNAHPDKSMTNVSFSTLSHSHEFLTFILNNINSCVLLLDKDMKLRAFNDAFKTIFSNSNDEDLLYLKCGNSIGCAYHIDEQKDCGNTSQCENCDLRLIALDSYLNDKPIYKRQTIRPFYTKEQKKVFKCLQFSTRLFVFEGEKYVMMIIDDITDISNN